MQFTLIPLIAAVSAAVAFPLVARQSDVYTCSSGSVQCCSVNVLGVADLDCANPPSTPANLTDFVAICAAIGQKAECCDIPILGQGLICSDAE